MKKIGLLSDTHGDLPEQVFSYFKEADEIWHAGDIGSLEVIEQLKAFKPLRIVWGNIDSAEIRFETTEFESFELEGVKVLMTHIGGRPGKYVAPAYARIRELKPDIFICGHSHNLLVQHDPYNKCLVLNPGACGKKGFHKFKTMLRFELEAGKVKNMEAIDLGPRA